MRQESAATPDNRLAISPERRRKDDAVDKNQFPQGTNLDAFFSLTGDDDGARAGRVDEDSSAAPSAKKVNLPVADAAAAPEMVPLTGHILDGTLGRGGGETKRGEHVDAVGGPQQQHAGRKIIGDTRASSPGRSAETERAPPRTKAEQDEPATPTTAGTRGSSSASPVPGPKILRKKKPATVISPELAALFHTPLLIPRHLDPPIAGSAAAAVMAGGGARRLKPVAGDGVVR